MSRPQVGWLATIRRGACACPGLPPSARPRISFCMLPPDRLRVTVSAGRLRCRARRSAAPGRPRARVQRAGGRPARARKAGLVHNARAGVLPQRQVTHHADGMAVLGMRATPACTKSRGRAGSARPSTLQRAASSATSPHSTSASACLAVARHTGHGQHLAARSARSRSAQQRRPGPRAPAARTAQRGTTAPGARAVFHRRRHAAADHGFGQHRLVGTRGGQHGHQPAGAQHRDAVRHPQHLVELVADEDDGQPGGHHLRQRGEQRLALLRREHGGRLVQDQDALAPRTSAFRISTRWRSPTDRLADARVGVDLQAETLRRRAAAAGARRRGAKRAATALRCPASRCPAPTGCRPA
jgi:hypothetical protein